ncbi:MAG: hypothetical protein J6U97_00155 [Bacteroidaceae bacterium]|nr:hypothetical protein [Bacteroidaceae bacterium]
MPNTIAENLQRLQAAKTAIGNAITTKGGTVGADDGLEDFASDVATITNQYTAGDEGKVVSNGALVSQTARADNITENGTYDTTLNNSVTVDVRSGSGIYEVLTCTTLTVTNSSGFILNFSDNYVQYVFAHVVFEVSENTEQVDFTYPTGFVPIATSSSKRFGCYYSNYSYASSGTTVWSTDGSTNLNPSQNKISIRPVASGTGYFASGYKYTFPMLFRVV